MIFLEYIDWLVYGMASYRTRYIDLGWNVWVQTERCGDVSGDSVSLVLKVSLYTAEYYTESAE